MRPLRAGRRDLLAIAFLAAFSAALLRKSLLQGGAMLGYDLFTYFFPAKVFFAEAVRHGHFPLWNPDIFFGAPYLANVQMATLYPPNLLFALASFPRALAFSQWLHLLIGGAGMYVLCRWGWGLDVCGALIGGLAFAGSGFFGAHMGHLNQVHAGVWLPWIALCIFRLAEALGAWRAQTVAARRRIVRLARLPWPWLVGGGVAVALQLTAGHTQEAYYSLFALGLLSLGFTAFPPARAPRRWTHLPAYVAVVVNGAVLAAAQLVPTLELTQLSYRQGGVPIEEAVAFGVERTYLLETLMPTFWSLPSQEVTGYVGVVAIPLVLAALATSSARRQVLGLTALALLAVALTMGTYTPLYFYLYRFVPLFNGFRAPGRWLLVSTFALAGLAAHGATALRYHGAVRRRERSAQRFGVALLAAAAALLFVVWRTNEVHAIQWLPQPRAAVLWQVAGLGSIALGLLGALSRRGWPRAALVLALALELGYASREMEYSHPGSPDLYQQPPAIAEALAQLPNAGAPPDRTLSIAVEERLDPRRLEQVTPEESPDFRHYASMREVLKPNLGVVYGLPTVDGYDGGLLPTRGYARFKSLLVTGEVPIPHYTLPPQMAGTANAPLLAALNVRYLLTDGRAGPPGAGWQLQDNLPGAAWTYSNPTVRPRAFFVRGVSVEADPDAAIRLLATIDLAQRAVVESPAGAVPAAETGTARDARIVRYSPGELEIEAGAGNTALLVMTESYYPGWRATIDGQPARIERADVLFRALAVPAGTHRIKLWFDPLSVKLGIALSTMALIANGVFWWGWHRWKSDVA